MSIIESAAEKLAKQIKKVSPNINVEIVRYYYIRVINNLIFYLFCIILLTLFNLKLSSFFIILISYTLLRRCFGGAHMESDIGCLILSIITMTGATWIVNYIKASIPLIIGIYIFTVLIIRWTGLIDSPKKRIIKLRDTFIKQGYFTIVFLAIISIILYYIDQSRIMSSGVIIGVLMETISLIIGKLKIGRNIV